jgi:hypothetical protein
MLPFCLKTLQAKPYTNNLSLTDAALTDVVAIVHLRFSLALCARGGCNCTSLPPLKGSAAHPEPAKIDKQQYL